MTNNSVDQRRRVYMSQSCQRPATEDKKSNRSSYELHFCTSTSEDQEKKKKASSVVRMSHSIIKIEKPSTNSRRKLCSRNCMAGTVTLVALVSLAMFIVFWCTNIFRDAILSSLVIKNGTSMFDWWQRPPVRATYRVKIFNYTNIEDFESGKANKLKVEEAGPYIYRETLLRVNPKMEDFGTVSYQEKRTFQWEGGRPDDESVTVPNVPLLATTAFARDMNFVARVGITAFLTGTQSKTFINVPAGGYLWGYKDKIFDMAKSILSWQEDLPIENYGVLAMKAGLSKDRLTIKTGEDDINELGLIKEVNGMKSRNVWGDDKCDKIEGTDGSIFPPILFQRANSTLKVYARDMCRTIQLEYKGNGNIHGIPTLTYKPPIDTLTSSATKDTCFCSKTSLDSSDSMRSCPPAGLFNTSRCNFNMPFLGSFPHFYGGDGTLLKEMDGLNPRAELHESAVEIHPRLGVPIGGQSRLQLNIEVRKAIGVPFLGKLKDGAILPLVWVEVAIDRVPDSLINLFYHAYFTAGAVETFMQWASLIGIAFSIFSVICMLK